MFIDIHAHAYKTSPPALPAAFPFPSASQMLKFYELHDVDRAVLLPLGPEVYMAQGNEEVLELAAAYPDCFIPFVNIHPRAISNSPDAPLGYMMHRYKELGAKGLGEVTCNLNIDDPYIRNFFRHAADSGLPVTIHLADRIGGAYGLCDLPGLPGLRKVLENFPDLKIFAHSAVFWSEIGQLDDLSQRRGYPSGKVIEGAVPRLLREYPNLYGDLSARSGCNALIRDPGYAVKFLDEFQDKLLFGLDICKPPGDDTFALGNFLLKLRDDGSISGEVFCKVARENAVRLLEL